jgi:hypothetical protein
MDKLSALLAAADKHAETLATQVAATTDKPQIRYLVYREFAQKKMYIQVKGPAVGWTTRDQATEFYSKADAKAIAKEKGGILQEIKI